MKPTDMEGIKGRRSWISEPPPRKKKQQKSSPVGEVRGWMHGDTLGIRRRFPPHAIKQSGYECNKTSEHQTLDLSKDKTDQRGLQMAEQNPTRGGGGGILRGNYFDGK